MILNKVSKKLAQGFTLIELLVVVALIGILAAIGAPMYTGYVDTVKQKDAQNSLQSIFMMQKDYFNQNYYYYIAPGGDQAAEINVNLFGATAGADGPIPLATNPYRFEIIGTASTYTATATNRTDDTKTFSITDTFSKTGF
jgi:prepilin-type N-terminal cleavage/methylation domain-containing protein